MINKKEYIWYASYGSNIFRERFLCYIQGGKPNGSQKEHEGCTDKSLPVGDENIGIKHELYFAQKSKSWNRGGVAFIRTDLNENAETLGRMYKITKEQFIEVVKQENNFLEELKVDFDKAIRKGSAIFKEKSWYGNLVFLGSNSGASIFTFTNAKNLDAEVNAPDVNYLRTIAIGLKETYNMENTAIENYLKSKTGITGTTMVDKLEEILE